MCRCNPLLFIRVVALLALCSLQACSTIHASDSGVVLPSLRFAKTFKASPAEQSNVSSSKWRGSHAVEVSVTGGSGEGSQTLEPGAVPIVTKATTIVPPARIAEEWDVGSATAAYRWRRMRGPVGFELLAGLGFASISADLATGTLRAHAGSDSGCASAGFGLLWDIGKHTSLAARGTGCGGGTSFNRGEIVLVQSFSEHVQVQLGWAATTFNNHSNAESDVRFKLSGVAVGLNLEF